MGTRYPKFNCEVAARTAVCVDCSVWQGGNNSVVECDLAKVEVAGSNPVSRSKLIPGALPPDPRHALSRDSAPIEMRLAKSRSVRVARSLGRSRACVGLAGGSSMIDR